MEYRRISSRDIPQIAKIEQQAMFYPWTREEIGSYVPANSCACGWVCVGRRGVCGYMLYRNNLKERVKLDRLAIRPDRLRGGIGTKLIAILKDAAAQPPRNIITRVHERCLPAQLFLRAMGFKAVCVLKPDRDTMEASYLFEFETPGSTRAIEISAGDMT